MPTTDVHTLESCNNRVGQPVARGATALVPLRQRAVQCRRPLSADVRSTQDGLPARTSTARRVIYVRSADGATHNLHYVTQVFHLQQQPAAGR